MSYWQLFRNSITKWMILMKTRFLKVWRLEVITLPAKLKNSMRKGQRSKKNSIRLRAQKMRISLLLKLRLSLNGTLTRSLNSLLRLMILRLLIIWESKKGNSKSSKRKSNTSSLFLKKKSMFSGSISTHLRTLRAFLKKWEMLSPKKATHLKKLSKHWTKDAKI